VSPLGRARIGLFSAAVVARLWIALLLCVAATLVLSDARAATPGITLDRIDLTLEIPDIQKDPMVQTKHTVVLYARSTTFTNRLPLAVAPLIVTAKERTSDALVATSRRVTEDDGFTDVTLPSGASQVELQFTTPLFESAIPRFWWDEMQVVLGWPFAAAVQPLTQGMQVTVLAPPKLGRAPGFSCTTEGAQVRCTRFFGPAELARYADKRDKGMVVASIPNDDATPLIVTAAQIGLWALLLLVIAVARAMRRNEGRVWVLLRTGLALVLFLPCIAGYALLADGETDGPLVASMSWAAGVLGVAALCLAHLDHPEHPIRNRIAQLMFAGAIPLALLVLAVSSSSPAALWVSGGLSFTAFLVMFGGDSKK
jgi:hypothetical protein